MTTIKPQTSAAVAIRQATRILGTDEAGVARLVDAGKLTEMYTRPTIGEPEAIYNVTELHALSEVERLRAGEADDPGDPASWPTPAEWIRRWNDATPTQRLAMAEAHITLERAAWAQARADLGHSGEPLPVWDQMSDLDKGAALLHLHKCEVEGTEYATSDYPARYFDHPALTALDGEAASEHAQRLLDSAEAAWSRLGPVEYDRLYGMALAADRKR